jgi:hypothetical protein
MASKVPKKGMFYALSRERLESAKDYDSFRAELTGESDRACAIIASANVEHYLLDLIETMFIPLGDNDKNDLLFSPGATLGSFASRIDIAYALGLITPAQKSDLTTIKKLRNAFAHAVKDVRFADTIISAQVRKLSSFVNYEGGARVDLFRRNYIFICYELISSLNLATIANAERHARILTNLARRNKHRLKGIERRLSLAKAGLNHADIELVNLSSLNWIAADEPVDPADLVPPMSEIEPALRPAVRAAVEAVLMERAKSR